MTRRWMTAAVAGLLCAGVAYAQDEEPAIPTDDSFVGDEARDQARDEPMSEPDLQPDRPIIVEDQDPDVTVTPVVEAEPERDRHDMRGVTVLLGGGVEGYSGALASQITPGPAWGVRLGVKPTRVLGFELAYNGAVNQIDDALVSAPVTGADIVRNGGEANITVGLTATPIQPYLLGGVGLSRYQVRAVTDNFDSDTTGHIPLGAGLRTHIGNFTADARFGYSLLFSQQFAELTETRDIIGLNTSTGARYMGTLNLGTTF